MKYLRYVLVLFLTLSFCGCWATWIPGMLSGGALSGGPQCPDPPLVRWMAPRIERDGQPHKPFDGQMIVRGRYSPDAEIVGPRHNSGCWTTAGLPLDELTVAVMTALERADLVQPRDGREGDTYMFQFEVKQQRLTKDRGDPVLEGGKCRATIVVSYSVFVSHGDALIWQEEIRGEQVVEYGPKVAPRHYGSTSDEAAAIEGAVANNLSVLIQRLRALQFDKGGQL